MKRAVVAAVAVLVVVPLAGFVTARVLLDGKALKTRAIEAVRRATGRELTIAGPVRLAWSLTPRLEASDISLANPPGMSRPAMAHVARVEAEVGLLPLLSRRVEIARIRLERPDVLLERDAEGRANWEFPLPPAEASAAPATPSAAPRMMVVVGQVDVLDGMLGFRQGGTALALTAPHVAYSSASGRVDGELALAGTAVSVGGTIGPLGAGALPLDLKLEGAGFSLGVNGTAAEAAVSARLPDLQRLAAMAGTALPPLRDLALQARVALAPGEVRLSGLQLTSAQGDVAGDVRLGFAPLPSLRGSLVSKRIDLDSLTQAAPAPAGRPAGPPGLTQSPPVPAVARPERVLPDGPLPFALLRRADADVQATAAEVVWRGRPYKDVKARLVMQDGRAQLDPFSLMGPGGPVQGKLLADAASDPPSVALTLMAPGLAAGPVLMALGAPDGVTGTADVDLEVSGKGATWRALAATLNGRAGLAVADAEVENRWLQEVLGEVLRAANVPVEAGGRSRVRCLAVRADAAAGQVTTRALVLDTTRLRVEGEGGLALADERLDLHLRPQLLAGGAQITVPVKVAGTLRSPKPTLDPGAISPGRIGLTIGGASAADPCGPALALARNGRAGSVPAAVPEADRRVKPADLLRSLLR